jgi:hypothetical protein
VYHFYDKATYARQSAEMSAKDSTDVGRVIRDSLKSLYSVALMELDTKLDSTQENAALLQTRLATKLDEIDQLKSEIRNILSKQNFTAGDLAEARKKIAELQEKVDELSNQKLSMEEEKKQLSNTLLQLTQNVDSLQMNIRRLSLENEALNEKVSLASVFVASEVKIDAVELKGAAEESTSQAKKADKFIASFIVQNRVSNFVSAEVTTVIVKPDGQVMQSTVWDSGTFDAKNEGKKNYTRKIKFDYEKGETKHLLFSIDTEKCQKGVYTFQVWHNGIMIGKATKTLS